ncbi:MAG TPA: glycosyltransferase family 4 protein [Gemmatimonadales bacterium]|nr:glycosyltransferase family 4 protein [Gemmatimonadales bacterium]
MTGKHLLLAYDFPPIGGGIARWMGELARQYPDRSLVVSTGTEAGSDETDALLPVMVDRVGVPARRLRTVTGLVRWSLRTEKLAREHGIDFSWCGNLRPAAYPARWLKRRKEVPYGVILHGGDLLTLQAQAEDSTRKRRVGKQLLGDAGILVTNSGYTRELALRTLAGLDLEIDPSRVVVVPLGTDPLKFRPDVDPGIAQKHFGLEHGRWLLTVARLTPHKGIDTALRAFARVAPDFPDLRYAIAGQGDDGDRLRRLAAELGVADRVRWLGAVTDDVLPSLYRNASIYLGLSRREGVDVEGFGISLVEASGSGVPVIGGRSGGIPDAVREGETGLLVSPTEVDEAVTAIAALLEDTAIAHRLANGGRQAVEQFYNWARVAKDLRRLGDEVTAASQVPGR